ncbi:ATPase domain-containing protein [Citrifermentans bremense]|uniref:ATPase domain-containing protein n=1 Tax=Citrifermentans bremense TaxID=60035 RepID=UPI00047CF01C|nr:ATPase domain-containing protein [Citrifermentans bremense]
MTKKHSELLPTGIPGLDEILLGGLTPGKMYLISGSPGTGKTTFSLQFVAEGIRRRERCLYIAVGGGGADLAAIAKAGDIFLDPDYFILHTVEISREIMKGPEQRIFHSAEMEPSGAMQDLLAELKRVKPQRLVIDSLSDLRLLSEDLTSFRRLVLALRQEFTGGECTVVFTNNIGESEVDTHLETICHGVIRLEQIVLGYGPVRRRLLVVKLRAKSYRSGWHDFRIEAEGINVFPSLIVGEHHWQKKKRTFASSGNKRLDLLLGGGMDMGTTTAIIGASGTGKTTLATQCVIAAAKRGETAAVYLFEEMEDSFQQRAEGLGLAVDDFIEQGLVTLHQIDVAEFSTGEFSAMLIREVEERGVRTIVIDTLSGYLNAMSDEKHLFVQLHQLLMYLSHKEVTTYLTVEQHGIFGDETTGTNVSYLADAILLLRFFEHRGEIKRAMSVVKKRRGAHEMTIREFSLSSEGITIGEPLVKMQGVLTGVPTLVG